MVSSIFVKCHGSPVLSYVLSSCSSLYIDYRTGGGGNQSEGENVGDKGKK